MRNKVVLFDIDYTLFNAKLYRQKFIAELAKEFKGDKDLFVTDAEKAYQDARKESTNFQPDVFLDKLYERVKKQFDKEELELILTDTSIITASIYPDVLPTLEKLSQQEDITLGIFSAGQHGIQRPKIISLEKFFEHKHVHIYEMHKIETLPDLLAHYAEDISLYIVDDIPNVLAEAKKLRSSTKAIWIDRGDFTREKVDYFNPDSIIKTLNEVIPIVMGS